MSARGDVQNLTSALTKSALKSDLDLNVASADLSQSQLLELDAENSVASASAMLAALLATPQRTPSIKQSKIQSRPPLRPPETSSTAGITAAAEAERPDLKSLQLNAESFQKLAKAQALQHLPSITAVGAGGITPAAPANVFVPDWYAAGGVNLTLSAFTGFRITAQTEEARLRAKAAEQQARELSDNIGRDVRVAILNAQTAFRRIGVADEFRHQTEQALALAQTRYKLGLSSIVELSQAQLQSTQAAVAAVNARYDYLLALRTLDYFRSRTTCPLNLLLRGLTQTPLSGWKTRMAWNEIKIDRILYATDFLENSRLALDYAVCFAQHFKATIVMLHVVLLSQAAREAEIEISGPSMTRKAVEQRLEKLAHGVRALGLSVETHVVDGLICETVIKSINQ